MYRTIIKKNLKIFFWTDNITIILSLIQISYKNIWLSKFNDYLLYDHNCYYNDSFSKFLVTNERGFLIFRKNINKLIKMLKIYHILSRRVF